jgi:hypothetical protein
VGTQTKGLTLTLYLSCIIFPLYHDSFLFPFSRIHQSHDAEIVLLNQSRKVALTVKDSCRTRRMKRLLNYCTSWAPPLRNLLRRSNVVFVLRHQPKLLKLGILVEFIFSVSIVRRKGGRGFFHCVQSCTDVFEVQR